MKGIGNDIVALDTIDPIRTRSPRFYSKFISPTEVALYTGEAGTLPFEHFVWLLWSVKEAAFKCLQRFQPNLVFSPLKMEVSQIEIPLDALVGVATNNIQVNYTDPHHPSHGLLAATPTTAATLKLFARSIIYGDDLIHTIVAFDANFSKAHCEIKNIESPDPENQSAAVRELLLNSLSANYPGKILSIEKDGYGIPNIFVDGRMLDLPISLSHHGEWVGYALQIP